MRKLVEKEEKAKDARTEKGKAQHNQTTKNGC